VVCIVDPPYSCIPKLNIPSGTVTMGQIWGRNVGVHPPGYICCFCSHRRIAAMITKNTVRFEVPVKECPTRDNVRIKVDIAVNFRIGPSEEDCVNFIYKLGAVRLDELLSAETEEAIRNFVHSHEVRQVQDLKAELAETMLYDLNHKFSQFGVHFESVVIVNVFIPESLQKTLSDATKYDVMFENQKKKVENDKLKIVNDGNIQLTELSRDNYRKLQELKASRDRALIEREEQKTTIFGQRDVAITGSLEWASVLKTKVSGERAVAESVAHKKVMELVNNVKADTQSKRTRIDQECSIRILQSHATLDATKMKYDALYEQGKAEGNMAESLKKKERV